MPYWVKEDREVTTKFLSDLNEQTAFTALGSNYVEQLKAAMNYSPLFKIKQLNQQSDNTLGDTNDGDDVPPNEVPVEPPPLPPLPEIEEPMQHYIHEFNFVSTIPITSIDDMVRILNTDYTQHNANIMTSPLKLFGEEDYRHNTPIFDVGVVLFAKDIKSMADKAENLVKTYEQQFFEVNKDLVQTKSPSVYYEGLPVNQTYSYVLTPRGVYRNYGKFTAKNYNILETFDNYIPILSRNGNVTKLSDIDYYTEYTSTRSDGSPYHQYKRTQELDSTQQSYIDSHSSGAFIATYNREVTQNELKLEFNFFNVTVRWVTPKHTLSFLNLNNLVTEF